MSSTVDDDSANALLIQVENFNNAAQSSDEMGTYLRLGAVPSAIKTAYTAVNGGGTDGGAFTAANGEDLASKVLTFIDDTRDRGNGDFNTLTQQERQTATQELHTKGGWRDHTDGNRVTTTRGDKVEVIGGNYKLMVLGREQWNDDAGGGLHHESSGGITYHYDEVPGQIVDVRRNSDGSTWNVIEECSTGHFVARYHGVDKEWHRGGDLKLRVVAWAPTRSSKRGRVGPRSRTTMVSRPIPTSTSRTTPLMPPGWIGRGTRRCPTCARRSFADTVKETTFAKTVEAKDGTSAYPISKIEEKTWAKKLYELNTFGIYEQKMKGELARESWYGTFLEVFLCGAAITLKYGFFWDFRVASSRPTSISPVPSCKPTCSGSELSSISR